MGDNGNDKNGKEFWGFKILSNDPEDQREAIPTARISKTRTGTRWNFKRNGYKRNSIESQSKF